MSLKNLKNEEMEPTMGSASRRYWYALIFAVLLILGVSVSLHAQTPSGTPNTANHDYPENRTNYNYLGLLGLLGLYGLHKKQLKNVTVENRKTF